MMRTLLSPPVVRVSGGGWVWSWEKKGRTWGQRRGGVRRVLGAR